MKKSLIFTLIISVFMLGASSCGAPKHTCNFSYAQKKNAKTMKKMHRYNKRHARY